MKRIRLTVAYDGTNYCGWQIQPNGITIQEVLENCLEDLTGKKTSIMGASRTDTGVHALGNVAVFDTDMRMPGEKFSFALNQRLEESDSKSVRQPTASEIIVESLDGDTPIKAKESRRREIRKLRSERRIMKEKVKKILLESGSEEVQDKERRRSQIRETEAQMHATRLEIERQKAEEKKLRDEIGENRRVLAKIGKTFSHTKTRMFV